MFYVEFESEPIAFCEHVETAIERARVCGAKVFREDGALIAEPVAKTKKPFILRSLRAE